MERPKLTDEQARQAIHACAMRNLENFDRESLERRLNERARNANKQLDSVEPEVRELQEKAAQNTQSRNL
jgi:hypothetical protein